MVRQESSALRRNLNFTLNLDQPFVGFKLSGVYQHSRQFRIGDELIERPEAFHAARALGRLVDAGWVQQVSGPRGRLSGRYQITEYGCWYWMAFLA